MGCEQASRLMLGATKPSRRHALSDQVVLGNCACN